MPAKKTCICNEDKEALWIQCQNKKCKAFWHNVCAGLNNITKSEIKNISQSYNCPRCVMINVVSEESCVTAGSGVSSCCSAKNKEAISHIKSTVRELKELIITGMPTGSQNENKISYAQATTAKGNETNTSKMFNKILKEVKKQNPANNDETKLKLERTRLIRNPMDKNITNTKQIRKELNKLYAGLLIRSCSYTNAGSIFLELHDKASAEAFHKSWKLDYLGGNKGLITPGEKQSSGLIKFVDETMTEKRIKEEILQQYEGTVVELFKKGPERIFTGTVKITFKNGQQYNEAVQNKIKIGNCRFYVEEFVSRPRVIKCNKCQEFGHISRMCRSSFIKCAKCNTLNHETKDCTVGEQEYKCCHCGQNHITGSRICDVMISKQKELTSRYSSSQYE